MTQLHCRSRNILTLFLILYFSNFYSTLSLEDSKSLDEVVRTNGTRSFLYIIYHDDKSLSMIKERVNLSYSWIKPKFIPTTAFFESIVYQYVFPHVMSEWQNLDYVITMTYKTLSGIDLYAGNRFEQSFNIVAQYLELAKAQSWEFIPFLRGSSWLLHQAIDQHGENFLHAWMELLQAMGYDKKKIHYFSHIFPFFRNIYIIKPEVLRGLTNFMNKAISIALTDEKIYKTLSENALYQSPTINVSTKAFNTSYYQMHPFVFERLPSFYLRSVDTRICSHKNVHSGSSLCKPNF